MKDLNKSQLILLAILISFITSIATGIVTVTLLQQAPTSITTPINRIVRETVEKIVPGESKTQTIIVKEEDLVVDAIAQNQSAMFSVSKEVLNENKEMIEISVGKGFAISTEDIIVADAWVIFGEGTYYVKNDSGKFKATFLSTNKNGFAFLKIGAPLDDKNKLVYIVPSFGDLENMKAGQKVILLGGAISSFIYEGSKDLKINVPASNAGGLLLDLDGNALGIALSGIVSSFASISDITESLKTFNEKTKA